MRLFFAIFVYILIAMKNLISHSIRLIAAAILVTLFSGCFMFHKKNRCGDCPKWKMELNNILGK